jgi:hypothetical protein
MCIFDDGRGPAIYVAGSFTNVNGIPARHIARWDGQAWEPLGAGLMYNSAGDSTYMGVVNDASGHSLVMVGEFIHGAGGGLSRRAVKWVGCPNCYANCDLSTEPPRLNVNDFTCFINKFAAKDPYANCNVDAEINASDFVCFINKYAAGCP